MQRLSSRLLLLGAVLLLLTGPSPCAAANGLLAPSADLIAPVLAAVTLAAQLCAGWLALVMLATAAATGPGRLARVATAALHLLAPSAVRQVTALALGLTVATAVPTDAAWATPTTPPATPLAASPAPRPGPPVQMPSAGLDLDWPVAPRAPLATRPAPSTPVATRTPPVATSASAPLPRVAAAGPSSRPTTAGLRAQQPAARRTEVVVRRGDSLWRLARRSLGPRATAGQVAVAWPSWWSANRQVIGDDPDLIQPGMRLVPPT